LLQLTAVFEDDPRAGLVGAKLIYPDGRLQEAGGIVWRDGSAANYGRGEDAAHPAYNYRREADYCSGAAIMLPTALWHELGGFDERYLPAYYEDTDLAFRVREAGRKVIYQPHAVVVHFEGQTSGTDLTQGIKRHQVRNQAVFEERWRTVLAGKRMHGVLAHRECDRGTVRRVLVIDASIPTPDRDSGSLRMVGILKALRELNCRVSFVAGSCQFGDAYGRALQSMGVEVLHRPYAGSVEGALEQRAGDFNVVIISHMEIAQQFANHARQRMPHAKLVFDTVDLHFLRHQREAELSGDPAGHDQAKVSQAIELGLIAAADITLVVSPFERDLLSRLAPKSRVMIASNVHTPAPGPRGFSERQGIVFIGGFRHPPNVDAIHWYANDVLPLLRSKAPGLRTTVIGSEIPESILQLAADDLVFTGHVPDVEPIYARARVAISPLRYGAGVKGKVNLPMQFGVPVVATPCSVEGMYLTHRKDVLVASDADEFARAIVELHGDDTLWQTLRKGGLANIEQYFSPANAKRTLAAILDL
jgi:hypothetical protein